MKLNKYSLVALVMATVNHNALAENWVVIGKSKGMSEGEILRIDMDSIDRVGDYVSVWQKYDIKAQNAQIFNRPNDNSLHNSGETVFIPDSQITQLMGYDCKKRIEIMVHLKVQQNNKIISDSDVVERNIGRRIEPGTDQEIIMNKVCKRAWEFWK
jgi:hypothetical protein